MPINYATPTSSRPFGGRIIGSRRSGGAFGVSSSSSGVLGKPPIARPIVQGPALGDFGTPSREGIGEVRGEALGFLNEFNHPQNSAAFKDLMNLASERTAIAASEDTRLASIQRQRQGYGGGSAGRRAATNRMQALALTGLEGASAIRQQALPGYQAATGAYASLAGGFNEQMGQRNLAYAGALQESRQLQAQLDSAFNNQLIDAAKYEQMSSSIAAQLEAQKAKLAEDARQFNARQPLDWARAETERIGTVGAERYGLPRFEDERLAGPEGMNPAQRPRSSFGPAFGSASSRGRGTFGRRR